MAIPIYRQVLGVGVETVAGTGVTPTIFLPIKKPSGFVPTYEDIEDDGFRNNASQLQGSQQGVGMTNWDTGEMLVYGDDSIVFLCDILGVDSISGAGPYTHVLTLLNTGDPKSLTLTLFDNVLATAWRIQNARVTEVALKWTTKTKLTMQVKGIGAIADSVAKPSETFSTVLPYTGWNYTASVNSASKTNVEEGEIIWKRAAEATYGPGSQGPGDFVIPELDVSGNLAFKMADATERLLYTGNTIPPVLITFTSNTANTSLAVQITKARFGKGTDMPRSGKYQTIKMPFRAIGNATDAGTGNSPSKVTATNARSTVYM